MYFLGRTYFSSRYFTFLVLSCVSYAFLASWHGVFEYYDEDLAILVNMGILWNHILFSSAVVIDGWTTLKPCFLHLGLAWYEGTCWNLRFGWTAQKKITICPKVYTWVTTLVYGIITTKAVGMKRFICGSASLLSFAMIGFGFRSFLEPWLWAEVL